MSELSQQTPHRIMYEVLTPEQYKNFCKNIKPKRVNTLLRASKVPSRILSIAFSWSLGPYPLIDNDCQCRDNTNKNNYSYWLNIFNKLYEEENE